MKTTFLLALTILSILSLSSCRNNTDQENEYEAELKKSYNEMNEQHSILKANFENQWYHVDNTLDYCRDVDTFRKKTKAFSTGIMADLSDIRYKLLGALGTGNIPGNTDKYVKPEDISSARDRIIAFRDSLNASSKIPTESLDTLTNELEQLRTDLNDIKPLTALHRMKRIELEFFRISEETQLLIWNRCIWKSDKYPQIVLSNSTYYKGQKGSGRAALITVTKGRLIKKLLVNGKNIPVDESGEGYFDVSTDKIGTHTLTGFMEISDPESRSIKQYPFMTEYEVFESLPVK